MVIRKIPIAFFKHCKYNEMFMESNNDSTIKVVMSKITERDQNYGSYNLPPEINIEKITGHISTVADSVSCAISSVLFFIATNDYLMTILQFSSNDEANIILKTVDSMRHASRIQLTKRKSCIVQILKRNKIINESNNNNLKSVLDWMLKTANYTITIDEFERKDKHSQIQTSIIELQQKKTYSKNQSSNILMRIVLDMVQLEQYILKMKEIYHS